jgi:hypothetical protein
MKIKMNKAECSKCNEMELVGFLYKYWGLCRKCWIVAIEASIKSKPLKSINQPKKNKTSAKEEIAGIFMYTKSNLHNKQWMSNKSIDNEVGVVKIWDKYILKTDIVNQWIKINLHK